MVKKLSRSYAERTLDQINQTYYTLSKSLTISFSNEDFLNEDIFLLKSHSEIEDIRSEEMIEIERYTSFDILSSIEAMFKVDYFYRCENKLRDELSRDFREIYKIHKKKVSLKDHILPTWTKYNPSQLILNELNSIFKYRHWIAHGRYWLLRVNVSKYDFNYLMTIAQTLENSIGFYGLKQL
ncbi:MAG: hypothetical protein JXR62_01870 [Bacilli bacterium]|nr:hypothetical protein [Bacilli bacterium]